MHIRYIISIITMIAQTTIIAIIPIIAIITLKILFKTLIWAYFQRVSTELSAFDTSG
jgi:hypothetical protein